MSTRTHRRIVAATFATVDTAPRAVGALASGLGSKLGNSAVVYVAPDGTAKFVESKDWGKGRGALVGGAIGLLGGPVTAIAVGTIGALAAKLRDAGFDNKELKELGKTLQPNTSAVVLEVEESAVDTARDLLASLGAVKLTDVAVGAELADLFEADTAA